MQGPCLEGQGQIEDQTCSEWNSSLCALDCIFETMPKSQYPRCSIDITFFKHGPAGPSQQCKRTSISIQDPLPHWILTIFKLKFGSGNLFSLAMVSTIERNNSMGSLLEPLLKKVTPLVGLRMLWTTDVIIDFYIPSRSCKKANEVS